MKILGFVLRVLLVLILGILIFISKGICGWFLLLKYLLNLPGDFINKVLYYYIFKKDQDRLENNIIFLLVCFRSFLWEGLLYLPISMFNWITITLLDYITKILTFGNMKGYKRIQALVKAEKGE
jgi:uncharacterized membrane-anchored protein